MSNAKYPVTPVGKLVYPYILEPDTEFDPEGVYHTKLALSIDEADALVEAINAARDTLSAEVQSKDSKKRAPKHGPLPYQVNQEDMTVEFKFKLKRTGKRRDGVEFTQQPVVRAPDGSNLQVRPANGSLGKIAYEIVPFYNAALGCGVQLRLRGVKVTQLVEFGSAGGDDMFGEEPTSESALGDF